MDEEGFYKVPYKRPESSFFFTSHCGFPVGRLDLCMGKFTFINGHPLVNQDSSAVPMIFFDLEFHPWILMIPNQLRFSCW